MSPCVYFNVLTRRAFYIHFVFSHTSCHTRHGVTHAMLSFALSLRPPLVSKPPPPEVVLARNSLTTIAELLELPAAAKRTKPL